MNKLIFSIILLFVTPNIFAQITSQMNGDYSVGGTWVGGIAPNALVDDVDILHHVMLDASITIEANFDVQDSLTGVLGHDILVSTGGIMTIGALNIDGDLTGDLTGHIEVSAGDTVYVDNIELKGSSTMTINNGAVVYVATNLSIINSANLTLETGAELNVGNNINVENNASFTVKIKFRS